MTFPVAQLGWIPLAPLAAAAVGLFAPRSARRLVAGAAIGAMVVAFVLSCAALATALAEPAVHAVTNFAWFTFGSSTLRLGLLLDPLTAFMLVMVTFVGTLIFVFSTAYLADDPRYTRFFCFLSLFAAAMLGLLVANSLLLLFACWEVVGLASYLLIGFWHHKPSAAAAAKKAFLTTRIGDLGFLLGLLWLTDAGGTLLFYDSGAGFLEPAALTTFGSTTVLGGLGLSTVLGLLIFCGAAGKSGQFPLHVWLPDAMEGPTPVSALIHAATMVAAGVFLIARIFPLMAADASNAALSVHALEVVAFVGAVTALFGALLAVAQNDLKRILAYSTVSQLGYMMLALGVGAWTAAVFHLLTHAFFKALLFLGAGSVIHGAHHEQDIRQLGGLARSMKVTFATFAIGMMALSGVPFLFSGFWSKEAILHAAHAWPTSHFPFLAALVAVVLTAFYMTRLMYAVFAGPRTRDPHLAEHAPHESPRAMTVPLILLAVGALALGFLGTPVWPWLQATLTGESVRTEPHAFSEGLPVMLLSIALVAVGLGAGWYCYGRLLRTTAATPDFLAARFPRLFNALEHRLYLDEIYAATLGRLFFTFAALADAADRWLWGGTVRLLALLGRFVGTSNREFDERSLHGGVDKTAAELVESGERYARSQTGDAQGYLRMMGAGFAVLGMLAWWGGVL